MLTKGIKPIEYVVYEAKKQNTIDFCKDNTHETAQLIPELVSKSNFDHVLKLEKILIAFNNFDINNFKKSFDISTL